MIWGWDLLLPGCGRISTSRGATLAARWINEPQPISTQPLRLGFPHRGGDIDPGDLLLRLPAVGFVKVWKHFLIRG